MGCASSRLLVLPLVDNTSNVKPTAFGPPNDSPRLANDRCINHLAIQCPGPSPLGLGFVVGDSDSDGPFHLCLARAKHVLNSVYLTRVDAF